MQFINAFTQKVTKENQHIFYLFSNFPTAKSSLKVYEREIQYSAHFLQVHTVAIKWKNREQMRIKPFNCNESRGSLRQ